MQLEIGKTYYIKHPRKGNFTCKVISNNSHTTTGIIIDGKTQAMSQEGGRGKGEEISMRNTFINDAKEVI